MYTPKDLAELRKRLGLTVVEFAGKLGVHRTTVYYWESGRSHPVYSQMLAIRKLAEKLSKDMATSS